MLSRFFFLCSSLSFHFNWNEVNNHIGYGQDFAGAFLLPTCVLGSSSVCIFTVPLLFRDIKEGWCYRYYTPMREEILLKSPLPSHFLLVFVSQKGNSVKQGMSLTRFEQPASSNCKGEISGLLRCRCRHGTLHHQTAPQLQNCFLGHVKTWTEYNVTNLVRYNNFDSVQISLEYYSVSATYYKTFSLLSGNSSRINVTE